MCEGWFFKASAGDKRHDCDCTIHLCRMSHCLSDWTTFMSFMLYMQEYKWNICLRFWPWSSHGLLKILTHFSTMSVLFAIVKSWYHGPTTPAGYCWCNTNMGYRHCNTNLDWKLGQLRKFTNIVARYRIAVLKGACPIIINAVWWDTNLQNLWYHFFLDQSRCFYSSLHWLQHSQWNTSHSDLLWSMIPI